MASLKTDQINPQDYLLSGCYDIFLIFNCL